MPVHKVYLTNKYCPLCSNPIVRIEPDYNGWKYWCPYCNNLVIPNEEIPKYEEEAKKKKAIGFIVAIAAPFSWSDCENIKYKIFEAQTSGLYETAILEETKVALKEEKEEKQVENSENKSSG